MTDLVKRAREGLKQCQELGIQYSPAQDLISDMADEMERLREALKRQLRHTLNSDLPRATEDYNFGKRALEGK